jgi:hypothetical protein
MASRAVDGAVFPPPVVAAAIDHPALLKGIGTVKLRLAAEVAGIQNTKIAVEVPTVTEAAAIL